MKLKSISYKIVIGDTSIRVVRGFAINSPIARICVRESAPKVWVADDFDTGYRIGGKFYDLDKCIHATLNRVAANIATGHYARCQADVLKGLKERGLI